MSVKIRLTRQGAKKRPFYHIVVADSHSARDGRFIERIGYYNPMVPKEHPQRLVFNAERATHWLSMGAQPSERVAGFLGAANIIPMPVRPDRPKKALPKAKAQERLKEQADREAAAIKAAADAKQAAEDAVIKAAADAKQAAEDAKQAAEDAAAAPAEDAVVEEAPAVDEPVAE